MSRVSTDELLFVCLPLRVPRAPNGHQRMPTEASGERLVQPSSREAEAENNRNCAALPQQTTGARVLHLALPWGGGGKASPLTLPPSPPSPVLTLAHKRTQQYTHARTHPRYSVLINHLQLCLYTHRHTHAHTESLYLYCIILLFIWIHISALFAFDS